MTDLPKNIKFVPSCNTTKIFSREQWRKSPIVALHVAGIAISLDCISIGIVVKSIAISLDCVLMDVDGGFDGGIDGWFHLAVLGYRPQRSVRQLRWAAFMAISREGLTGLSWNKLIVCRLILQVFVRRTCHFTGSFKGSLNASFKRLFEGSLMAIIVVT